MFTTLFAKHWLIAQIFIALFLEVGGILVLRALWWEEAGEEDEYADIDHFRASKLKAKRGRKLLMFAIIVEICLGAAVIVWDAYGLRQVRIVEAKNNPLQHPVSNVYAILRILVSATNYDPNIPIALNRNWLAFGSFNLRVKEEPIYYKHIDNYVSQHVAFYESAIRFDQNTFPIAVWNDINSTNPDFTLPPSITVTDAMSQITSFQGYIDFIPKTAQVVKCRLVICMNGFQKNIQLGADCISKQMSEWNPDSPGIFLVATNFGTNASLWRSPQD